MVANVASDVVMVNDGVRADTSGGAIPTAAAVFSALGKVPNYANPAVNYPYCGIVTP